MILNKWKPMIDRPQTINFKLQKRQKQQRMI